MFCESLWMTSTVSSEAHMMLTVCGYEHMNLISRAAPESLHKHFSTSFNKTIIRYTQKLDGLHYNPPE